MNKSLSQLNLDLLRVFHLTAKFSSMTLAAKALFITQPAVSHSVSQLEELLGYSLLERSRRKLALTDEGRILFETTTAMFDVLSKGDKQLEDLHRAKAGILRIGCPFLLMHTCLRPFLARFHKQHPAFRIHIEIENRMQPMLDLLRQRKIDLLFLATPEFKRIESEFVEKLLGTYRYAFMASREHFPELMGRELTFEEVNRHPIVILRPGNNTRDYTEKAFARSGLILNAQWETDTMALTAEFTKAGFGIGVMLLSDQPIITPDFEGLFELSLKEKLPKGRYLVLHRHPSTLTESSKLFLDMVLA